MIKQVETDKKLVFGVDFETRTRRVQKEKPVAKPKPEHCCRFLEAIEAPDGITPWGKTMQPQQCQEEALPNGWCAQHQHAQDGMDLGERLGYRSVEIAEAYTIIGQGKENWEAYFEKSTGKGLATVLNYLKRRLEGIQ